MLFSFMCLKAPTPHCITVNVVGIHSYCIIYAHYCNPEDIFFSQFISMAHFLAISISASDYNRNDPNTVGTIMYQWG